MPPFPGKCRQISARITVSPFLPRCRKRMLGFMPSGNRYVRTISFRHEKFPAKIIAQEKRVPHRTLSIHPLSSGLASDAPVRFPLKCWLADAIAASRCRRKQQIGLGPAGKKLKLAPARLEAFQNAVPDD